MLEIILYTIIGLLLLATWLPTLPSHKNFVRYFDFPRLQIGSLLLIFNLILYFFYGLADNLVIIISVFSLLKIVSEFLPYTPFAKNEVCGTNKKADIKIFIANVLEENDEHEKLISEIEEQDPDVIFLVETNKKWQGFMKPVTQKYEHKVELPLEEHNGMLLYSRFKLDDVQIRYLVLDFIPSITANVTLENGEIVRFYGIHPRPPRPRNKVINRDKELKIIAEEISQQELPVIITGDLNDVGWSPTTKRFIKESRLLDPRKGRGLFNTYNAKLWPFRWPLDHVFVTKHFKVSAIKRLPYYGSDHFPIYIELSL